MSRDQVTVVAIAAAWASAVGVAGLAAGWLLRRGSVRRLTVLVAVIAVGAVVAGMIGTARAMFLSEHDFSVAVLVAATAAIVAVGVALAVAAALGRWSRELREEARRFGDSGTFVAAQELPADLRDLADELARTSARLAEARRHEHRLEESRRELISWISHDLRSPLAAIRAMSEALEDGLADDPARYQRQIRAEVDRMVRLVDDLFELSRIQAGLLRLNPELLEVGDLVSDAVAALDPVARISGVRLGGEVPTGVRVRADPAELGRVVTNLLLNGIRHTPADGVVEVRGRVRDDAVELSVTDGCGGIPTADLDRVFDVAWQGDPARTPQPHAGRGAGIGLAIVKGLVEAHHGRVSVTNTGPGCAFVVTLPGATGP